MLSKAAVALPLAAALFEQTSAFSFHRHQHEVEKRAVVYETVYTTTVVTVTADGSEHSPVETQPAFVADNKPTPAVEAVSVEASAAPAPAAYAQQDPPSPPPAQVTFSTAVKPAFTLPVLSDLGNLLPTKSASSAAPSSTGSNPPFAKRGIAYNDVGMANAFKQACKGYCGWSYNWGSSPGNDLDSNMHYVPMLWGDAPVHTDNWHRDADAALDKGSEYLLSFNEPDMPSQSNMSPEAAAAAHAKYFSKYVGRAKIGAPAVSNSGQPGQGIEWLKAFMKSCNGMSDCHVDFCPVHWYSEAQFANTLHEHLDQAEEACGDDKSVWLTEFAPFGNDAQISSFMKENIPKLESRKNLQAYSYFMVAQNQLMSSNTAPSTIGNVYAAIPN